MKRKTEHRLILQVKQFTRDGHAYLKIFTNVASSEQLHSLVTALIWRIDICKHQSAFSGSCTECTQWTPKGEDTQLPLTITLMGRLYGDEKIIYHLTVF